VLVLRRHALTPRPPKEFAMSKRQRIWPVTETVTVHYRETRNDIVPCNRVAAPASVAFVGCCARPVPSGKQYEGRPKHELEREKRDG
jgi:hypothetical protein